MSQGKMYSPTPTSSLLTTISGIVTAITAFVASKGKTNFHFKINVEFLKSFDSYLSDGSNGRPRLRLGAGPRKPRPDFPFDNSTRARRPHMVRPSKPRTASSASRASSNSTNAKLFFCFVGGKIVHQNPKKILMATYGRHYSLTQADFLLSIHCVVVRNS